MEKKIRPYSVVVSTLGFQPERLVSNTSKAESNRMNYEEQKQIAEAIIQLAKFSNLDEYEIVDCIEGIVFAEEECSQINLLLEKIL